jgi:hypothetical protein
MQQLKSWKKGVCEECPDYWNLIHYAGEYSCAWINVGSIISSELMLIICLLGLHQGLVKFNKERKHQCNEFMCFSYVSVSQIGQSTVSNCIG